VSSVVPSAAIVARPTPHALAGVEDVAVTTTWPLDEVLETESRL
jgi:hypothetical protein